jgi:hypothetical protein
VFSTTTLCSLFYSLCSLDIIIFQIYNEGVYISFPSCALKLSNLSIKFYLPTFITHKGSYLLWIRGDLSRSFYNNTSMPPLNDLINYSKIFSKNVLGDFPAVSHLCTISLLAKLARLAMLLHHTPSLENFHGLLSMSLHIVCPCFWISTSFSQLSSSTGWPFHLTKYSKYFFLLVLLPTLLSSMRSIYGFSATGICFVH